MGDTCTRRPFLAGTVGLDLPTKNSEDQIILDRKLCAGGLRKRASFSIQAAETAARIVT